MPCCLRFPVLSCAAIPAFFSFSKPFSAPSCSTKQRKPPRNTGSRPYLRDNSAFHLISIHFPPHSVPQCFLPSHAKQRKPPCKLHPILFPSLSRPKSGRNRRSAAYVSLPVPIHLLRLYEHSALFLPLSSMGCGRDAEEEKEETEVRKKEGRGRWDKNLEGGQKRTRSSSFRLPASFLIPQNATRYVYTNITRHNLSYFFSKPFLMQNMTR